MSESGTGLFGVTSPGQWNPSTTPEAGKKLALSEKMDLQDPKNYATV